MGRMQNASHVAAGWILLRLLLLLPDASLAFVVRYSPRPTTTTGIITPLQSSVVATADTKLEDQSDPETSSSTGQRQILDELCELFDIEPQGTIRLDSDESALQSLKHDSVRGVYLNHAVAAGNIILSVPLQNCLRDDEPPSWFQQQDTTSEDDSLYHPSDWATRLAASLLDRKQKQGRSGNKETDHKGMSLWLSLLPDSDFLRASLPVHWSEEILHDARCTALDLAVDSAYFARAQAVADLEEAYDKIHMATDDDDDGSSDIDLQDWRRLCENALDIVQTRSCRVVYEKDGITQEWGPPLRLLAPVFDLINHGGKALANAEFRLEAEAEEQDSKDNGVENAMPRLVVRATRDLDADEQVLIDYGDSARPAWKCLASYGFVPPFQQGGYDDDDDDDEEHVAEVYIDGVRYEVTPTTIPQDMVASMAASETQAAVVDLTPDVAIGLAQRMSNLAQSLLDVMETKEPSEQDDNINNELSLLFPEQIVSSKLASSLRLNQHRILIACSMGLRDWAAGGNSNQ
jgi:hypothetical protein